jgi:hypothetical protein
MGLKKMVAGIRGKPDRSFFDHCGWRRCGTGHQTLFDFDVMLATDITGSETQLMWMEIAM